MEYHRPSGYAITGWRNECHRLTDVESKSRGYFEYMKEGA
jgi:hypothetical protein